MLIQKNNDIIAIEVKSSESVDISDARHLLKAKRSLGKNFKTGLIIYRGAFFSELEDGIFAMPMSWLWGNADLPIYTS